MEKKIVIPEILKTSWKSLIAEIWLLAGLVIGYTIITLFLSLFVTDLKEGANITTVVIIALTGIFSFIFILGYTKNLFQTLDREEPQFSAYGRQSLKTLTYLIAYFLFFGIVTIGIALLIVPGIYLALRLQFFQAAIVDENAGVIDSFKRSWEITKGQTLSLFLLMLVMTGLFIAGLIALGAGIFMVMPFTGLIYCCTFRKLTFSTD
ncbi:MAG: hypothetical protein LBH90_02285 [Tannerella sp.]|nr:hypothetical protein [Tannerella sp.]